MVQRVHIKSVWGPHYNKIVWGIHIMRGSGGSTLYRRVHRSRGAHTFEVQGLVLGGPTWPTPGGPGAHIRNGETTLGLKVRGAHTKGELKGSTLGGSI